MHGGGFCVGGRGRKLSRRARVRLLEEGLAQEWNALGRELIQQDAEAMDECLRDHAAERPGWVIVRRNDVKELLTLFGPVRYGRQIFPQRGDGACCNPANDWGGADTSCPGGSAGQDNAGGTSCRCTASQEWAMAAGIPPSRFRGKP